jgi:hypothetical protein
MGSGCTVRVDTIMTRDVVSCTLNESLHGIWSVMKSRGLQRIPILDEDGRPVGIIYARDALQCLLSDVENDEALLRDYVMNVGYQWGQPGWTKPNAAEGGLDVSDHPPERLTEALQRQRALSRWDNEGGAQADRPPAAPHAVEGQPPLPKMGDAELEALHVRIIALENLVIALLAAASDRELDVAREMASYISPQPGFTHHPLTLHAAAHMVDIVERACRFRSE